MNCPYSKFRSASLIRAVVKSIVDKQIVRIDCANIACLRLLESIALLAIHRNNLAIAITPAI
jgi:hypothetical protein